MKKGVLEKPEGKNLSKVLGNAKKPKDMGSVIDVYRTMLRGVFMMAVEGSARLSLMTFGFHILTSFRISKGSGANPLRQSSPIAALLLRLTSATDSPKS
jgi:hypothetical protein